MNKKLLGATGLLTVGLLAGGIASAATAANAADDNASAVSTATATDSNPSTTDAATPPTFGGGGHDFDGDGPHAHADGDFNPGGADPVRDDEKAVSADIATKLTDLALAEVPDATVIRVETDGDGAAFEVHLTKADGTLVTVKFDANYAVIEVQDGMGKGGPKGKAAGHVDGVGHGRHGAPGQDKNSSNGTDDTTSTN